MAAGRKKRPLAISLAAEEQAADGSQSLRDAMIGQALGEGHPVEEIAEALGLSEKAVYRIAAESGGDKGGGLPAGDRAAITALDTLTDPAAFERLALTLVRELEPDVVATGGPGDRGMDGSNPDHSTVVVVSIDRQWRRKLKADLEKIAAHGITPARVYAITSRRTSRTAVDAAVAEAADGGIELRVLDQKWLLQMLGSSRHLHLRTDLLHIPPPRSETFLRPDRYRGLLDGRPHQSGFGIGFEGRDVELGAAARLLEDERALLLEGPGGYGKTRLALELSAADGREWRFIDSPMQLRPSSIAELPVDPDLTVVIDNAHLREDLDALLSSLERLRGGTPRIVVIARPDFRGKLDSALGRSWVGPIGDDRTVRIGPLGWSAMSAILKAPPLGIESGAQRGSIVQLAEGNPQVAVIAAKVAAKRRSVIGLSGEDLLQRYVGYLIVSATRGQSELGRRRALLASLAALEGIDLGNADLVADVAGMLQISEKLMRDELEELAEGGLVVSNREQFQIKPDLLAEHILFALTLSERWALELDYRSIFEQLGRRHLSRMVRALGALPGPLFDDGEASDRVRPLEDAVAEVALSAPPEDGARLIRDLSRARPTAAREMATALLRSFSAKGERPSEIVTGLLREAAMRMGDFRQSWKLLLALGVASDRDEGARKQIGEAMSETYQRVPEGDPASGAILAEVQDALAAETRRFWSLRGEGAAGAVALAVKPMLMLTFNVHRQSADSPMSIEFGSRILPDSDHTATVVAEGGKLAAEIFPALGPEAQLGLIEVLNGAAHVAAGFSAGMGEAAPIEGRLLLQRSLAPVDAVLSGSPEGLAMPVRAAVYDYLLKRHHYSRKLAEEAGSRPGTSRGPQPPAVGAELEEYIFVIHNRPVGPPGRDRRGVRAEYERKRARAAALAKELCDEPDWRERIDRWSAWWRGRLDLEPKAVLGPTPGMAFEAVALADPDKGSELIDHLIARDPELAATSAGAMRAVLASGPEDRWERWLTAEHAAVRGALARALSPLGAEIAAAPMRTLAFDQDAGVRGAVIDGLAFAPVPEDWRLELALEAIAAYPEIESLNQVLHMAAENSQADQPRFSRHQLEEIETALVGSARGERIEGYELAECLRIVGPQLPGLAMRWVWARIDELEKMQGRSLFEIDFLDEELAPIIRESHSSADLERAIDRIAQAAERSPGLPDVAKLIGWMDPGSEKVTRLIVAMLEDPDRAWRARAYLMDLPLSDEELDRRALAFARDLEEPGGPVHELIRGRLPNGWSGSYVPHLESALKIAERWSGSGDRELAAAGAEAAKSFKKQIGAEEAREAAEDLAFSYR
jgi:hypothetical protein